MTDKGILDKLQGAFFGELENEPGSGRIRAEGAGLVFSVYEGGSFTDDENKVHTYNAGIKISIGTRSLRLEPGQVAVLKNILAMPEICEAVQVRIDQENEKRKNLRM